MPKFKTLKKENMLRNWDNGKSKNGFNGRGKNKGTTIIKHSFLCLKIVILCYIFILSDFRAKYILF